MVRVVARARSKIWLAGTPVRSGRTPVIIITWLGMVSITHSDAVSGKFSPPWRSACRFGVSPGVISSGRQPSTTST